MRPTPLIQAAVKQAVAESRGSARDAGQRMKQWLEAQLIRPTPPLIEDMARLTPTSLFADGAFRDALHATRNSPIGGIANAIVERIRTPSRRRSRRSKLRRTLRSLS